MKCQYYLPYLFYVPKCEKAYLYKGLEWTKHWSMNNKGFMFYLLHWTKFVNYITLFHFFLCTNQFNARVHWSLNSKKFFFGTKKFTLRTCGECSLFADTFLSVDRKKGSHETATGCHNLNYFKSLLSWYMDTELSICKVASLLVTK